MLLQRILLLVALPYGDPSRPTTNVDVAVQPPLPLSLPAHLGLDAYTAALRAEDIVTAQDLLLLSIADMADLGLSIGARNRLVHWQQQQQQQRQGQAQQQPLPPPVGARANPAYNLTFDVRLYGADPNANCCAEAAIQSAINASGQNYAGDYNCGQVTPSHLLRLLSPVFSPFVLGFCAFLPPRRDGSNEPKTGIQGQETVSRAPNDRAAYARDRGGDGDPVRRPTRVAGVSVRPRHAEGSARVFVDVGHIYRAKDV